MKHCFHNLFVFFMISTFSGEAIAQQSTSSDFTWGQLSPIPDSVGFAGSFAGVSNGVLLVAGGANFPDGGTPWLGSKKKWHDKIFALESSSGQWKEVGKLPRPLGYGVSISCPEGLLCLGGSNESGHYADAFIITYKDGKLATEELPAMPKALANSCGAIIGDIIYIAGGTESPDSKDSESVFWSFDLSKKREMKWRTLESWPGPSRMLSTAGSLNEAFYLFSGANLIDGKRLYLTDAYKYVPGTGWFKIADLPQSVVAAPGPAYAKGSSQLVLFGGDDGKDAVNAAVLKERHPGFSKKIWNYDSLADSWTSTGNIFTDKKEDADLNPNGSVWAPVTTALVLWNGRIILPGGEVRPAIRTPRVLIATPLPR